MEKALFSRMHDLQYKVERYAEEKKAVAEVISLSLSLYVPLANLEKANLVHGALSSAKSGPLQKETFSPSSLYFIPFMFIRFLES